MKKIVLWIIPSIVVIVAIGLSWMHYETKQVQADTKAVATKQTQSADLIRHKMKSSKKQSIDKEQALTVSEAQHAAKQANEIDRPTLKEVAAYQQTADYKQVISKANETLRIPSIHLDLPIITGVTSSHLKVGAATYGQAFQASQHQNILLGHNMGKSNLLFSDVPKVKKGAAIYIDQNGSEYVYHVTSIQKVRYDKSTVLTSQPKNHTLTLITCDKGTATNYRIVVTAN